MPTLRLLYYDAAANLQLFTCALLNIYSALVFRRIAGELKEKCDILGNWLICFLAYS